MANAKGMSLVHMVKFLRSRREQAQRLLPPDLQHYLDTRINIARNMDANFPPKGATIAAVAAHYISLESKISDAYSPATNLKVANVVRVDIACRWTTPAKDSLKVTTYVAKRF